MAGNRETGQTQWLIVWVAFGAGIVAATHVGKLPPALPEIRADLGAGLVLGGWIASMISCTGFALGIVSGTLADRIGQRRVLIMGLIAMTVGSLGGAFEDQHFSCFVGRSLNLRNPACFWKSR